MPIKFACRCGQAFAVKDQLAGKAVKCPQCGQALRIPRPRTAAPAAPSRKPGGISDLLDEAGMRANVKRCPGCGGELPEQAVLCVMCGFDLQRGHRIKTIVATTVEIDQEDLGDLPKHGNPVLDHAERVIARTIIEEKRLNVGAPWWMVFLAFAGVAGFVVGMVSMPQERVMDTSGWVLLAAGGLLSLFGTIRLLILAFQESAVQGLLSFFVPVYILYYVVTRWDRCGGVFVMLMGSWALLGAGYLLLALAPLFRGRGEGQQTMLPPRPAVAVVPSDHQPDFPSPGFQPPHHSKTPAPNWPLSGRLPWDGDGRCEWGRWGGRGSLSAG
jgi:hypothetical protein